MNAAIPPKPAEQPKRDHQIWAFRGSQGSAADLCAEIDASKAPAEVKAYLKWLVTSREGKAFKLDTQGLSDHDGELCEHTHIRKIF